MNAGMPQNTRHVVDLLPAYASGRLEAQETRQVQEHLLRCTYAGQSWQHGRRYETACILSPSQRRCPLPPF